MKFNISDIINSISDDIIKSLAKYHLWDYTAYGLQRGYNWILSGRGGGKSTGIQSIAIKTFVKTGFQTIVLRACRDECTQNMMSKYFDGLRGIVFDDGKNIIQKLTDDKFNTVYYNRAKKSFILCNETDNIDDIKDNVPFMIMTSIDNANLICSGFNYPDARIIFVEECLDDKIPRNALINLENIISTIFRFRVDTYVILTGNLSRGNPRLLIDMKLYDKIKTSQIPFIKSKTKYNSNITIELFDALPEQNSEKRQFNDMYFCFGIEGEDIVRGCSNSVPLYRQVPPTIIKPVYLPVGLYLYTLDRYFEIKVLSSQNFQEMFFINQCDPVTIHDTSHIILTDDELYSYNTPYAYLNPLKKYKCTVDLVKAIRRKDVCYNDYLSCIATTNLLDTFKIPEIL